MSPLYIPPAVGGGGVLPGVFDVTKAPYSVTNDGVTNYSTAIQQALTDANAAGGGIVQLPPYTIVCGGLVVPSNVYLLGCGWGATMLKAPASLSGFVARTGDGAVNCGIQKLGVDGNRANAPASSGIEVSSNVALVGDCQISLHELYVTSCGQDGIRLAGGTNARTGFLSRFYVTRSGRYGIYHSSTDWHVSDGAVGGTTEHGIYIASGGDSFYTAVRSFYAGWTSGSGFTLDRSGWFIATGPQRTTFTGCSSQDNGIYGWDIGGDENIFTGCKFGGENQRNNANGGGIRLAGVSNLYQGSWVTADLSHNGSYVIVDGAAAQGNRLDLRGGTPLAAAARVKAINTGTVGGNKIVWNGEDYRWAAVAGPSTMSVYGQRRIVSLTQNLVISTSPWAQYGDELALIFVQDVTGGRTVTWPGGTKLLGWTLDTTTNATSSISLVYDGTNWVRRS